MGKVIEALSASSSSLEAGSLLLIIKTRFMVNRADASSGLSGSQS